MRWIILTATLLAALGTLGTAQAASKGTLDRIKERGEIRIGYREATEPFSFKDSEGNASGYSVELCQRIAAAVKDELKMKDLGIVYVPVSVKERFEAVASSKVDILCSATTITLKRMETVDFSLMTFVTGGGILSLATAPVAMVGDLGGKRVAVIRGTTTETALKDYLAESMIDARLVASDSIEDALVMLEAEEVDAVADDQIVLIGQVMVSGDPRAYSIAPDLFSYEPYGLALPRNDAAFSLVANRALARLYRTGQNRQLYEKWFGRAGVQPSPILQAMYKLLALPE